MEIWRPIERAPPYEVSSLGRIRNGETKHILSLYKNPKGNRWQCTVYVHGNPITLSPHREMPLAFELRRLNYDGKLFRHDDVITFANGDENDLRLENLIIETASDACKRHYRDGLKHAHSHKFPVFDKTSGIHYPSLKACADSLGVSPSAVCHAVKWNKKCQQHEIVYDEHV